MSEIQINKIVRMSDITQYSSLKSILAQISDTYSNDEIKNFTNSFLFFLFFSRARFRLAKISRCLTRIYKVEDFFK